MRGKFRVVAGIVGVLFCGDGDARGDRCGHVCRCALLTAISVRDRPVWLVSFCNGLCTTTDDRRVGATDVWCN